MRIIITGATGMLGQALCKALATHSLIPLSSSECDVTSLETVRRVFSDLKADWVLHAAAFTRVDEAELKPLQAYRVNALGTRNVALATRENRGKLLYYSSDYVFDGTQDRPYREWDDTNPLNEYGQSKLAGEFFVRSLCPEHLIVRTSWLYGPGGTHFVGKVLDLAKATRSLEVVSDQRGCPTFTTDLAYMTLCLIESQKFGTYHVTNSDSCSWHELACEIVGLRSLEVTVRAVDSSRMDSPVPRPACSVLDNYLLQLEGIPLLRSWRSALAAFLTSERGVGHA